MSLKHSVPVHADSNGENMANPIASRELAPSSFYAPEPQNGNAGPAAEFEEKNVEDQDRSRKRSRTDSDFSEVEEEDAGSDFDAGDSADSDNSFDRYKVFMKCTDLFLIFGLEGARFAIKIGRSAGPTCKAY